MALPILSWLRLATLILLLGSGAQLLPAQEPETRTNQTEITFQRPVEPPPSTPAELADRVLTQQALRSYLQLQEQMHAALLAIQKSRDEAQAAAAQNKEDIGDRLKSIETTLATQSAQNAQASQSSNQLVLMMAAALAAIGFLAVIAVSWMQLRAMNRMTQLARPMAAPTAPLTSPPIAGMLGGEERLLISNQAEQSSARLRSAVQTLENRLRELEQTAHGSGQRVMVSSQNGKNLPEPMLDSDRAGRVSLLLGKGQSLLHLNEAADALECFDQVLALDPRNTEALIKKGTSLERLKRLEEAIECYDQAISVNDGMTLAYLYKGGVYNQLERYNEALKCYEHALRTQQKEQLSVG